MDFSETMLKAGWKYFAWRSLWMQKSFERKEIKIHDQKYFWVNSLKSWFWFSVDSEKMVCLSHDRLQRNARKVHRKVMMVELTTVIVLSVIMKYTLQSNKTFCTRNCHVSTINFLLRKCCSSLEKRVWNKNRESRSLCFVVVSQFTMNVLSYFFEHQNESVWWFSERYLIRWTSKLKYLDHLFDSGHKKFKPICNLINVKKQPTAHV